MDRDIVVIAHNIRSSHNIGSLFRTCEGLGAKKLFLSGYTPYPIGKDDARLPHVAKKVNGQISKTALGAENYLAWEHAENIESIIQNLKQNGYKIYALEQSSKSIHLESFKPSKKIALILGNELEGISQNILDKTDGILEIPMLGKKESFNVGQAGAMAIYRLRFFR